MLRGRWDAVIFARWNPGAASDAGAKFSSRIRDASATQQRSNKMSKCMMRRRSDSDRGLSAENAGRL
jgi:hypothetical protein